jgi:purine-nucleoside phosphorylase
MMNKKLAELTQAVDFIKSKWPKLEELAPKVAVVLGSGLSACTDHLKGSFSSAIPFQEIPHFCGSTVDGHKGELILTLTPDKTPLIVMSGRVHFYEGLEAHQVIIPIRVLGMLGCTTAVLTNASGAIGDNFEPGQFMVVQDHINFTGHSPLVGGNLSELGPRFVDMSQAYDPSLIKIAKRAAAHLDIKMHEGVYAGLLGPCYETPAEIRMLKMLGAHAVGMSTVFEVIAARHMNMRVLTIACLTNKAAGLAVGNISHEEVMENNTKLSSKLGLMLGKIVREI